MKKNLKYIKNFDRAKGLSDESRNDLTNFKDDLLFVSEFDIELYEAIQIIDKILKSNLDQIQEWRDHLTTNYATTKNNDFILELIDRYVD